nr:EOG090X0BCY [Sida crystallina]
MSNRALRKLHGTKDDISTLASNLQLDEENDDNFNNLNEGDDSDHSVKNESEEDGPEGEAEEVAVVTGAKPKKKQKRKKRQQQVTEVTAEVDDEFFLQMDRSNVNDDNSATSLKPSPKKNPLALEQKSLNPDNELKRIFGSRIVQSGQKKKARGRAYVKSSWLVTAKPNWDQIKRTGLSMVLDHTKDGCFYFKYEHNKEYRQIQFLFWDAVSSLNPGNIVSIVNAHPYHIDSLIQLSDICRMGDDTQMATELIERSLYILESAFHPSFNLASGNCRLEYKQQENRALFLALFKHLVYIGLRGCYRTALEFCKLLYSLDVDNDPLAVLLMIDFYAIRAQEYMWFIEFFQTFEPKKNLSQLPNLAYAIALAHFYQSKAETNGSLHQADRYIQHALLMFPAVLVPLLEKCSIQADGRVLKHEYFSAQMQASHPPSLNHLIQLYIGRSFHTWKDPDLLPWLERNANIVLDQVDRNPSMTRDFEDKRKKRYQGTPRNIYRHILLSDIKDATATLPQELANSPVLSYDPLPPIDSLSTYSRPSRNASNSSNQSEGGLLSTFFRSLLPGYNIQDVDNPQLLQQHQNQLEQQVVQPQLERLDGGQGAEAPVEGAGANLQRSVTSLFNAMRDLLSSIHLNDGEHPAEEDEDDDGDETD